MTRSCNEVEMLVLKACRGAQLPLAQAQDVARVAAFDPACVADILALLAAPQGKADVTVSAGVRFEGAHVLRDVPLALDAVQGGADFAELPGVAPGPFVAAACRYFGTKAAPFQDGIRIESAVKPKDCTPKRCDIPEAHWAALSAFAARILVPETDASRLAGAGAGLTDND